MKIPTGLALWAIPAEPELAQLQSIIGSLTSKFRGPVFSAHVTAFSGHYENGPVPETVLEGLTPLLVDQKKFTLKVKGLEFGTSYFRCCTVRLEDPEHQLAALNQKISALTGLQYTLNPHLSLYYGELNAAEQHEVQKEIHLPTQLKVATLGISLTPPGLTSNEEAVASWKIAQEYYLD